VDEALRHQILEQQAAGEDEEAREIAAAIADIERQEREEIERALARDEVQARQTARRQEERLRAERLQAETERRRKNHALEQAERVEVKRLRATADELESLWNAFHRVHRMQRRVLLQRHAETRSELALDAREAKSTYRETSSSNETAFRTRHSDLMQELRDASTTAPQALRSRQQVEGSDRVSLPTHFNSGTSWGRGADHSGICTAYAQQPTEIRSSAAVDKKREKKALDQQELRQVVDIMWLEALVSERSRMLEDLEARMVSPPPNAVATRAY
jgi:hypothetical protein